MTSTPSDEKFVTRLIATCNDRGTRAELRRYWSAATRHYSYPVLGHLGVMTRGPESPDAITAALYAENPHHQLGGHRLGQALLKLAGGGEKADGFESFERHFRRLLACDSSDLPELADQLHRLFKRLERESIAIDFNQLLWNLRTWHLKSTKIKTDWASEFWTAPSEVTTPTV